MQYTKSIKVAASKYGAKSFARKDFADYFKLHHKNVLVAETGLNLNASIPYFGASPDGFAFFSCHGKGILEIECPYNYRNSLEGWQFDPLFSISPDGNIKKNHKYYFQMQHLMLVTDLKHTYFYAWTNGPKDNNFLLFKVDRDDE